MPRNFFMRGPAPIRRTLQFLEAGKIALRDEVRIVNVYFKTRDIAHKGTREFTFWNLPQLQYKNPEVQLLAFVNTTPTPLIEAILESGQKVIIDVFNHSRQEIHDRLWRTLGKSDQILSAEARARQIVTNPGNFGKGFLRHCICEIPGQVPCPEVVMFPKEMRGKFREDPYNPDSPMKEE